MLIIRFKRVGKRNRPFFRVVLTDHTKAAKGEAKETLGFYNPLTKENSLKEDRIRYWMGHGVKTSVTVHNLLVSSGIIQGPKRPLHALTQKKKGETPQTPPPESAVKEGEKDVPAKGTS